MSGQWYLGNSRNKGISPTDGGFQLQNHRHLSQQHTGNKWLNRMYPRKAILLFPLRDRSQGGVGEEGCSRPLSSWEVWSREAVGWQPSRTLQSQRVFKKRKKKKKMMMMKMNTMG